MTMMLAAAVFYGMTAATPSLDPLEAYVAWSRAALKKAGLVRKTTDDGSVYWSGGKSDGNVLVLLHGVNDQAGTRARRTFRQPRTCPKCRGEQKTEQHERR